MNLKRFAAPPISTNAEGLYAAPNLTPGTYKVTIGATGFAPTILQKCCRPSVYSTKSTRTLRWVSRRTSRRGTSERSAAWARTLPMAEAVRSRTTCPSTVLETVTIQTVFLRVFGHRPRGGFNARVFHYPQQCTGRFWENRGWCDPCRLAVRHEFTSRHGTRISAKKAIRRSNCFDAARILPFRRDPFGTSVGSPILQDNRFLFGDDVGLRAEWPPPMLREIFAASDGTRLRPVPRVAPLRQAVRPLPVAECPTA